MLPASDAHYLHATVESASPSPACCHQELVAIACTLLASDAPHPHVAGESSLPLLACCRRGPLSSPARCPQVMPLICTPLLRVCRYCPHVAVESPSLYRPRWYTEIYISRRRIAPTTKTNEGNFGQPFGPRSLTTAPLQPSASAASRLSTANVSWMIHQVALNRWDTPDVWMVTCVDG